MNRKTRNILIISGTVLIFIMAGFVVKKYDAKKVPVYLVEQLSDSADNGDNDITISGTVFTDVSQEIRLLENQTVEEIFVKEGQKVSKGDPLVSFDYTVENLNLEIKKQDKNIIEIKIKKFQKEMQDVNNNIEAENEKISDISDKETLGESKKKQLKKIEEQIKALQFDKKELELEINQLERQLQNQVAKSSVNGVVKKVGNPKESFQNNLPLILVQGNEGMYVKGNIGEMQLNEIKTGMILSGFSYDTGSVFTAEVREVSQYPSEDNDVQEKNNESMYPFIAYIENPERLSNGNLVELNMGVPSEHALNKVNISKAFVKSENGKNYVLIDNGKGKLKKQKVTVSKIVWGEIYELETGLKAKDKIAFPYGKNVKEGARTKSADAEKLYE